MLCTHTVVKMMKVELERKEASEKFYVDDGPHKAAPAIDLESDMVLEVSLCLVRPLIPCCHG